ncbi:MAG: hypothetical protein R3303_10245 [Marinobacter sp.]|nr:hypothetical protein [Marinobacter sp.]
MKRQVAAVLLSIAFASPLAAHANPGKGGDLPPGLQKKVERGESLPPGWQKKLHQGDRLPEDYERYGEVEHEGDRYDRVRVEDRVFRVIRDSREIVDILNGN